MTTIATSRPKRANLKTMRSLYNTLLEYKDEDGRSLIALFMQLPSRKEFPDYYEIIHQPIAMSLINEKIDKNRYSSEELLVDDFKLMFRNCRSYNQENSQIYNDAVTLESVLTKRWKMFERAQENAMSQNDSNNSISTTTVENNTNNTVADLTSNTDSNSQATTTTTTNTTTTATTTTTPSRRTKREKKGDKSDQPKRQLLTGYIIYASETRKRVIDNNPDQSFGNISRLVGTEWKALPPSVKSAYEQRALQHNARVREKAEKALALGISNGMEVTPKRRKKLKGLKNDNPNSFSKRRRKMMQSAKYSSLNDCNNSNDISMDGMGIASPASSSCDTQMNNPFGTPYMYSNGDSQGQDGTITPSGNMYSSSKRYNKNAHKFMKSNNVVSIGVQVEVGPPLFVEPPPTKPLMYSETFKRYIESLQLEKQQQQQMVTPQSAISQSTNSIPIAVTNSANYNNFSTNGASTPHYQNYHNGAKQNSQSYNLQNGQLLNGTNGFRNDVIQKPIVDESELPMDWLANGIGDHESGSEAMWALRDFILDHAIA